MILQQLTSIDEWKDDSKAFIFTLKNPHGVKPTRFMKRKEEYAIRCRTNWGPIFGNGFDIFIGDFCNKGNSCINNDGTHAYECHPQYKSSLFVKTDKSDRRNIFSVLDYEVFTHL